MFNYFKNNFFSSPFLFFFFLICGGFFFFNMSRWFLKKIFCNSDMLNVSFSPPTETENETTKQIKTPDHSRQRKKTTLKKKK